MTDTIFVPSFGNRPRNLVGREKVLQQFKMCLQSPLGSRDRALLLLGQQGSGKTVLLLEMEELSRRNGYVVASPTVVSKSMLPRILEKLIDDGADYLDKQRTKLSGGSVNVFGFGGGIQFQDDVPETKTFSWQLSSICTDLNKKGKSVLILIDEVQANSEELKQLIIAYQELVGVGADIAIVFAGLPIAIANTLNDHVLTFLNRARKIDVGPLRINDIDTYYWSVFQEIGLKISDELRLNAAKATAGSPYLMQLVGHYLTVMADESGRISESVYCIARQKAIDDYKTDICQTTVAPLSEKDIDFLIAMSEDEKESKLSDIAARMEATSAYVQTYKRRLIQAAVIEPVRRGFVRFVTPYLGEYIRTHYLD